MSLDMPNPLEPGRTGHRWIDLAVAVFALSISLVSILAARDTSQTMEKLARASFWPFLQLDSGNADDDGQPEISFSVENVGTGPARIHTFSVQVDGRPVSSQGHRLTNILRACCDDEYSAALARANGDIAAMYGIELSSPVGRRFLAPNDDLIAIRWRPSETNQALWTALDQARQEGRITMSACYCSVFDECWVARSNRFPPEDIDSCTADQPRSPAP